MTRAPYRNQQGFIDEAREFAALGLLELVDARRLKGLGFGRALVDRNRDTVDVS